MAEKTIKLNLNVDSKSGEASIKRTSGQIKALGATAAASSAAIGTGSKAAAGGILLMSASTIKAAGGTSKLGKETHKLITKMAGSKTAALKQAKAFVKTDVAMLKLMKTMKASAVAINKQKQRVLASVSAMIRFRKEADKTTKSIDKQNKSLGSGDGGKGGGKGLIGSLLGYKTAILAVAVAGTYMAYRMAKTSAMAEQQRDAFTNLANSHGINSQKMIDDLKAASKQSISTAVLIQKAGTAMMMGIVEEMYLPISSPPTIPLI